MTHTDDITDPTWHDIFDRDNEIKRLKIQLDKKIELIEKLLDVQSESMRDFAHHIDLKDAIIEDLRQELATLRNRENHCPASSKEGR